MLPASSSAAGVEALTTAVLDAELEWPAAQLPVLSGRACTASGRASLPRCAQPAYPDGHRLSLLHSSQMVPPAATATSATARAARRVRLGGCCCSLRMQAHQHWGWSSTLPGCCRMATTCSASSDRSKDHIRIQSVCDRMQFERQASRPGNSHRSANLQVQCGTAEV